MIRTKRKILSLLVLYIILPLEIFKENIGDNNDYCSNWDGIPDNLDTAMQYSDGKTYFFKDGRYYKFDDRTLSVEEDKPSYPRDTGEYWFGCRRRNSPLLFPK